MLGGEPAPIPLSTEGLKASLLRLQNEWEAIQASHDRDAIYRYLGAVFELVEWWTTEGSFLPEAAYRSNKTAVAKGLHPCLG